MTHNALRRYATIAPKPTHYQAGSCDRHRLDRDLLARGRRSVLDDVECLGAGFVSNIFGGFVTEQIELGKTRGEG